MKERFFLSSLFIKALFNFHLPDIFIISTYHTSTTTTTCMEKKNNVIKEMGKNCCNTTVSFFQYTQHKPSLMSILKKACKKELIKKIYMAWFLIIAANLFPKYLLWKRVQNHKKYFFYITLLYSRYSFRVEEVLNMEDFWRADSNLQDSLLKSQSWIQDWKSWWQWWITYYVQGLESSYFRPTLSLCQPHNPILGICSTFT